MSISHVMCAETCRTCQGRRGPEGRPLEKCRVCGGAGTETRSVAVVDFVKDVLGIELAPHQLAALQSGETVTSGRRTGMSVAESHRVVDAFMLRDRVRAVGGIMHGRKGTVTRSGSGFVWVMLDEVAYGDVFMPADLVLTDRACRHRKLARAVDQDTVPECANCGVALPRTCFTLGCGGRCEEGFLMCQQCVYGERKFVVGVDPALPGSDPALPGSDHTVIREVPE